VVYTVRDKKPNSETLFIMKKRTNPLLIKFKLFAWLTKGRHFIVIGVIFSIVVAFFLLSSNLVRNYNASAASISFAGGQISLDKKFVQGNNEFDKTSTLPGGEVTVRVKYNNTGNQIAQNTLINDTLPSNFTFVPGSLKNCYADIGCANLSDGLVSATGFSVSPAAGFYGNPTNSSNQMDLEIGKKHFLHLVECFQSTTTSNIGTFNIDSSSLTNNSTVSNANTLIPICASNNAISGSFIQTLDLAGNKYLHLTECLEIAGSDTNSFNISSLSRSTNTVANNSTVHTPNCTSSQTITSSISKNIQLFGNRFIHLVECVEISGTGDINSFNLDSPGRTTSTTSNNSNSLAPTCSSTVNVSETVVQTFDTLDSTRGYGYVEYKIKANTTALGLYSSSATMTGSFGSLTASSPQSIDIISCNGLNPSLWERNVTLSDAELRSDQDFTCNYTPKICPVVFNDLNADGIQSSNETNVSGQTIQLYREDGLALVTSLVTDAAGLVCFNTVAGGGTVYKITNPNPLTPTLTTLSNTLTTVVGSNNLTSTLKFGYSLGILTLTVPPTVVFPPTVISSTSSTRCVEVNPIQVLDSRSDQPGWSVTGVVEDFTVPQSNKTLLVANKFTSSPGTVTTIIGQSGPQVGNSRTVTSTTDPFTVVTSGAGQGKGTYRVNQSLCQIVDPYSQSGSYQSVITYTII
jgi:uncharacterized repeat protein (TIGR01451 family)